MVFESNVYPRDDTVMSDDTGFVWAWANRAAEREIIESVVEKIITSLRYNTAVSTHVVKKHLPLGGVGLES